MPDFRRYAAIMAVFASVLYVALVVAGFGILSLWLDEDVISDPDAGPIAGPIMSAFAVAVVFAYLLTLALRVPKERQRVAPLSALLVGFAAYAVFAIVGGVALGLGDAEAFGFVIALGSQLLSPFALAAGVLAFIVVLLDMIVIASQIGDRGRPRWPWEKRDDEGGS
jgi:hypothetical protein